MQNNPRVPRLASSAPAALPGPLSSSLKRGVLPGEGAIREVCPSSAAEAVHA